MDEQALIQALEAEGFTDVRVCPIPPNKELPEHTHDEHTVHIILKGELQISDANGKHVYAAGDRVEFPAGTSHKARGSTSDGTMIVGVKPQV